MLDSKVSVEYAVGRIHALENSFFLNKTDFAKLSSSKNMSEFMQILKSLNYGKTHGDVETQNFKDLLLLELFCLKNLIREISPKPEITDLFFIDEVAHNLKVCIKAKYSSFHGKDLMLDSCLFAKDIIRACVSTGDYGLMGDIFSKELKDIENITDPCLISTKVDQACLCFVVNRLKKCKNPDNNILLEFFQNKMFYINSLARLRLKQLNYSQDEIDKLLIPSDLLAEAPVEDVQITEDFEQKLEEKLCLYLERYRYKILSILPIVYFIQKKKLEIYKLKEIAIQRCII